MSRPNRLGYTLWVLREVGSSRLKISESLADTDVDDAALTIQANPTDLATVDVAGGQKMSHGSDWLDVVVASRLMRVRMSLSERRAGCLRDMTTMNQGR